MSNLCEITASLLTPPGGGPEGPDIELPSGSEGPLVDLGFPSGGGVSSDTVVSGVGAGVSGTLTGSGGSVTGSGRTPVSTPSDRAEFCERDITCRMVKEAVNALPALRGVPSILGVNPKALLQKLAEDICDLMKPGVWLSPRGPAVAVPASADLNAIADDLKMGLDPEVTIPKRVMKRIKKQPNVRQNGALGLLAAAVDFPQPMYEPLRDISQDLVLPGVERVPDNTLAVLTPNRRFIESYMVALNHAFSAEVQFRGAPLTLRNSAFRQFWDVRGYVSPNQEENFKDIPPITEWAAASALGAHDPRGLPANKQQLVLLIRGELLKKYPNTLIYAVKGLMSGGKRQPALNEYVANSEAANPRIQPVFYGTLRPDLTFFGFPFTVEDARGSASYPDGVYLVIEELVSEARFGLDLPTNEATAPPALEDDWENFNWSHLQPPAGGPYTRFAENTYINDKIPSDATATPRWATSSGTVAWITLQRPTRIVVHADQMIP
jgi:hypothetical protein